MLPIGEEEIMLKNLKALPFLIIHQKLRNIMLLGCGLYL